MKKIKPMNFFLNLVFSISTISLSGCLESSFYLAPESRLPKWFSVPDDMTRSELKVTMDYYSYPSQSEAVFKLYKNDQYFKLKEVTGVMKKGGPTELKTPPAGAPKSYPAYEIITVNGVTDIIEHRKMEPIFYITDDPAIWKELGVEQK